MATMAIAAVVAVVAAVAVAPMAVAIHHRILTQTPVAPIGGEVK